MLDDWTLWVGLRVVLYCFISNKGAENVAKAGLYLGVQEVVVGILEIEILMVRGKRIE